MKFNRSMLGWVIFVGVAILLLSAVYHHLSSANTKEVDQTTFWTLVKNSSVAEVTIDNNKLDAVLRPEAAKQYADHITVKMDTRAANEQWFQDRLEAGGVKVKAEPGENWYTGLLPTLLLYGMLGLLVWFFFLRQFRAAGGGSGILGNFGRSRHRMTTKEHTNVTFDDVAGIEEAKEEVRELIEFLKNPRKFQRLGARIPRGVLLVGDPGCGKTLLAKAIAGEAEVPFFSISGSDFVEMFVGVGASRVRDLFKQAKENSPCIIFLDEIDAVGRRRGAGFNGGGHDEREQTLNAILVEMDGFDSSDQIIVIAATNRVDVLDPALTRPGRFDRQITVPLPDIKGRMEILQIYLAKVKASPDVDLHRLARGTPMFSGADLAALINEAAIAATLAEKEFVEQADLEEARDKVRWGRARKSRVIDEQEKRVTAYHEAGHTLVQMLNSNADPVHKVSIIPRGPTGGATFSLPEKDRYLYTKKYCAAMLQVCMGGRLAEALFCDDISSGASMDIHQATSIARRMVLDWGMSERLGMVRYAPQEHGGPWAEMNTKEYSDATAEVIDEEVRRIIDEAHQAAMNLMQTHRDKLEALAQALLKYETLDGDEVKQILDGKPLNRPSMNDLLENESRRPAPPSAKKRTDSRPATEGPGVDIAPHPA